MASEPLRWRGWQTSRACLLGALAAAPGSVTMLRASSAYSSHPVSDYVRLRLASKVHTQIEQKSSSIGTEIERVWDENRPSLEQLSSAKPSNNVRGKACRLKKAGCDIPSVKS
jgi:hypothetical protein